MELLHSVRLPKQELLRLRHRQQLPGRSVSKLGVAAKVLGLGLSSDEVLAYCFPLSLGVISAMFLAIMIPNALVGFAVCR